MDSLDQKSPGSDTVFSEILSGEARSSIVFEDDLCLAFMDLHPINPGHVLIIPKLVAESLSDLDEEVAGHLLKIGRRVAEAIRQSDLRCEGVNIFLSDGSAAGQEVRHIHLHVCPRFKGDGFGFLFSKNNCQLQGREKLDANAKELAKHIRKFDGVSPTKNLRRDS